MNQTAGTVQVDFDQAIMRLTIDHTAKKNALTPEMLGQIRAAFEQMPERVRVVVLRGAGGSFCAGFDISALPGADEVAADAADFPGSDILAETVAAMNAVAVPIVAMVEGPCFGAGGELAIAADFRLASDDLKYCMPPAKLGLVYSASGLGRFVHTIGYQATKDLFMTGRVVGSEEALQMRLVDRVFVKQDYDSGAEAFVAQLLANAPLAVQGTKRVMDMIVDHRSALDQPTINQIRLKAFRSEDHQEARVAFAQKRPPVFQGR